MHVKKYLTLITIFFCVSSFSQTSIIPQVENGRNILFHINKSSSTYFFDFTISPWGNWLFASKQFINISTAVLTSGVIHLAIRLCTVRLISGHMTATMVNGSLP